MTTARNAMTTAAELMAVGSATAAAVVVWLLLARPLEIVDAVRGDQLGGIARLALATLRDLLMRLLDLL